MFTSYFEEKSAELRSKVSRRAVTPVSDGSVKARPVEPGDYRDLLAFFAELLPDSIHVSSGKIRSKTHLLQRQVDTIFYKKWSKGLVDMCGGWHLVGHVQGVMGVELSLSTQGLINHLSLTQAVKTLYAKSHDLADDQYVPLCSVLFAYDNKVPLISHQKALYDAQKEKKIPFNCEIDLVIILDQAVIMKDWQTGKFKIIETGKDSLMWGYILLLEYLGLDQSLPFPAREYVKRTEPYAEY